MSAVRTFPRVERFGALRNCLPVEPADHAPAKFADPPETTVSLRHIEAEAAALAEKIAARKADLK